METGAVRGRRRRRRRLRHFSSRVVFSLKKELRNVSKTFKVQEICPLPRLDI